MRGISTHVKPSHPRETHTVSLAPDQREGGSVNAAWWGEKKEIKKLS